MQLLNWKIEFNWLVNYFIFIFTILLFLLNSSNAQVINKYSSSNFIDEGKSSANSDEFKEALEPIQLEIYLNGVREKSISLVLLRSDGKILVRSQDILRWRLLNYNNAVAYYKDEPYFLLDSFVGIKYEINSKAQSLWISVPIKEFALDVIDNKKLTSISATMPKTGAFLNYDLTSQRMNNYQTSGAQIGVGFFSHGAVLTSNFVAPNLVETHKFIRLESTITIDRQTEMDSLRLGDSISRGGGWGQPVRFGGIQWSTNFNTQPEFVTFPLPSFSGSAALPSTAQVFINNMNMFQHDVQPGPFSITSLPVITGQGEMNIVIRDLLGREQTIVQPFYAASNLLRKGLYDFSYEFGALRNNFTTISDSYGKPIFSGTARKGVNDNITVEVHGELEPTFGNFGFSANILLYEMGIFNVAFANSRGSLGGGALMALGFERLTRYISFGLHSQITSKYFEQLGLENASFAPIRQHTAHIGFNNEIFGSFGLGYIQKDNRYQMSNRIISASYNKLVEKNWNLGLSIFKSLIGIKNYAFSVALSHTFGAETTASVSSSKGSNLNSQYLQIQKNIPIGTGFGYRILTGQDNHSRFESTLNFQNNYGTYMLEAARIQEMNAYRASISGAVAVLGNETYFSRLLGDSFAVVHVPNYSNVQIYAENQPVARTDKSGGALVPGLRAFQKNYISIEQSDLPFDAKIERLDMIVVPYYHSGYDVFFPIERSNDAVFRVLTENGNPVPSGASVRIVGGGEIFPVALDGQVYMQGLSEKNNVEIFWDDEICNLSFNYLKSKMISPNLGTFFCNKPTP